MPTIAATVFPAEAYVRLDVSWADLPAVQYARVIRVNTVTGEDTLLHPYVAYNDAGDLLLDCGEGVWWDTDPPLGVALQYRTEAAAVLTNKAANSSFEAGTAPWVGTNGVLVQSATFAHSGANSGRMTPAGGNFSVTVTQTAIPITAGQDVTASCWVLSPQGWNACRLQLRWFNGATQLGIAQSDMEIIDDGEWRWLRLTATPPAGTTTASVTFEASGTPPNTTLFYLDQFEVGQFTAVTSYAITGNVTVNGTSPFYIKDPLNPCGDLALTKCIPGPQVCTTERGMMVLSYSRRESYEPGTIGLQPANRRHKIGIIRDDRDTDTIMAVITRRFEDRDALKNTLKPGTVLLIQAPPEYGIADRYVLRLSPYTIDVPLPDVRVQPRLFNIPMEATDPPAGPMNGPCGARIDDLCDLYSSWAAMKIAGLTWRQLIYGAASLSSPGIDTSTWRTFDDVNADFASFNAVNNGVRTFTGLLQGL